MDYLAVWGTEQFQFGIFMMCFGIVIGAMCAYGALKYKAHKLASSMIDEEEYEILSKSMHK